MSRFDKYDGMTGGFKAYLAAAIPAADAGKIRGAGLDANGRVVIGAGQSGVRGVVCATEGMAAGDPIDVMTDGEIVEAALSDGTTALAAGTNYYSDAAGALSTTNSGTYVGTTALAQRLIVRVAR
jgi:hypothetical protein